MTLMIDDTPYIIIDNQKIAPLHRVPALSLASAEKPNRADRPFGVVDRVTISREAMEKYRQFQVQVEAEPPALTCLYKKPRTIAIPRLADSPKKCR